MFLLSLVALARAAPLAFIVEVSDPDRLLVGTPTLRVKDSRGRAASIPLKDDGVMPDPVADDQRWSGGTEARLVGPYALTLGSSNRKTYTATLSAKNPNEPGLSVAPRADGTVVDVEHAVGGGLVVEVSDPDRLLVGTPTLRVKDAHGEEVSISVRDDGVAPDPTADDRRWCGGTETRLVGPYTLTVGATGDTTYTTTLAAEDPDEPGFSVAPRADGTLVLVEGTGEINFVVELSDPERLLTGTPTLRVKDARGVEVTLPIHDDGRPPDPTADDRRWSGGTDVRLDSPYVVTVESTDGKVWMATLPAANPDEPGLQIAPRADGTVASTLGLAPQLSPDEISPPQGQGRGSGEARQGEIALALTWIAALGTLAWALAARFGPVPRSLPGVATALPGRGRVCVRGEVAALVRALVRTHRVVLVGPVPDGLAHDGAEDPGEALRRGAGPPPSPEDHGKEPLPAGALFPVGPGRVAMEDVLAVVGALQGRGAPLVVLIAGPLESSGTDGAHRAAARRLAGYLPAGVVLYDFEDGPPTWEVDPAGRLVPL